MPPAQRRPAKKAAARKPYKPGCQHCRVWAARGTQLVIYCPHCLHVFARWDEPDRDAEWCAKQAAETLRGHKVARPTGRETPCVRLIRTAKTS